MGNNQGTDLISYYFSLGIIFEMPITLETTFDNLTEFLSEVSLIEEVMHPETGTRCLAGIRWADTLLGGSNAI